MAAARQHLQGLAAGLHSGQADAAHVAQGHEQLRWLAAHLAAGVVRRGRLECPQVGPVGA